MHSVFTVKIRWKKRETTEDRREFIPSSGDEDEGQKKSTEEESEMIAYVKIIL